MGKEIWEKHFTVLFSHPDFQGKLSTIWFAHGCREGWVQGEVYRFFHALYEDDFQVNSAALGAGKTADIRCLEGEDRKPMLGEIKVIGASYQPKCLTGGALMPAIKYLEKHDWKVPARPSEFREEIFDKEQKRWGEHWWGLIPDYYRLAGCGSDATKVLVLFTDSPDTGQRHSTNLHNALLNIQFPGARPIKIDSGNFVLRLWIF